MEHIALATEENRVSLVPFALIRIFLGVIWLFEAIHGAPWALPSIIPGILLLIGLLTPPAAVVGMVLTALVYEQSTTPQAWEPWPWLYWLVALMHIVVFFTAAGRVWGIDAVLAKRKSLWPLW